MKFKWFVAVIGLLCSSLSMAAERFAVIDAVYHSRAELVIGDSLVKMALNLAVTDSRGKLVNRYALKVGQKVVYQYNISESGIEEVTAIAIKPANYRYRQEEQP